MKPSIMNELSILNTLDHPNIANFNECYEDDTFFHAILEYSPGECFAELLLNRKERLPLPDILKIFYQICKTAAYLRKQEIIHRDYKPPNIMVYKSENCKLLGYQIQLIDFGFARRFKESINDKEIMGSPHYVAPESLKQSYSYPADVWSIGIMLYYWIALEYPFEGDDEKKLFKAIWEKELVLRPVDAWEEVPKNLKSLVEAMLEKDPKERIDIEAIPVHKAFAEIHKIEESVELTDSDKLKLNRYYRLIPIQRKFLKYSTKFIPPKEKVEHCEKFTLLDRENFGYIEFTTFENSDDSEEDDE